LHHAVDVHVVGEGPPIAILYGSPVLRESFQLLVEPLSARRRVVLVGLPGSLHRAEEPYTMHRTLQTIERALREQDPDPPHGWDLVGFSSGAYRALAVAVRRRLRCRRLVLLGGFANLPAEDRAAAAGLEAIAATGTGISEVMRARFLSKAAREDPALVAQIDAWSRSDIAATIAELRCLAASDDLRACVDDLDVPMLLRVGEEDVAAPPALSEEIHARAPRAILQRAPAKGHALFVEDAEPTAHAVVDFLAASSDQP
jgi:3-oxoadipate enol-lactonase